MNILKVLPATALIVLTYACSHPIEIIGDGDVLSATRTRNCYLEDARAGKDNCTRNIVIGAYSETYFAEPRDGREFVRWANYCEDATTNECVFNVPADLVKQSWGATVPPLVAVFSNAPVFSKTFENGLGAWSVDNGVWGVGDPTAGPSACYESAQCAGTVLDGNYPESTDSRLISATITLPAVTGLEELHLRFRNWFSYARNDSGQIQVSVRSAGGTFGAWVDEATSVVNDSAGWSLKDVDLTAYAGETIRIAFQHNAGFPYESTGWYVDDVEVVTF